jgi:hypothetical protein
VANLIGVFYLKYMTKELKEELEEKVLYSPYWDGDINTEISFSCCSDRVITYDVEFYDYECEVYRCFEFSFIMADELETFMDKESINSLMNSDVSYLSVRQFDKRNNVTRLVNDVISYTPMKDSKTQLN